MKHRSLKKQLTAQFYRGNLPAFIGMYLLFEKLALNYRPVHIQGILEASYPSSTTLLTLCVMGTARMQLKRRIRRPRLQKNLL